MFTNSKYLVVRMGNLEMPFVFSELMPHDRMATNLGMAPGQVLGAGFCHISGGRYKCYGESSSLKVKSRRDADDRVLNNLLGTSDEEPSDRMEGLD